ncbi:hypothetical protein PsorP6_002500 [Peronosclerospora sorghi]|uniref:Uncharacterized protein n=1 Tax=Peronosclerospora sorghi TaxID=230839 RepID=A0ACC0WY74_9STRA|nr:hypothetical protein PsorP6_002500 [Peronosclerospora sorghi]
MATLLIEESKAMNPEALFSVETPLTLMTEEEFTRFDGRSNQRGAPVFAAAPRVAQEALNSTLLANIGKDWTTSGCVVNVKNQSHCGSCWAFAAVAALESDIYIAGQLLTSLSKQRRKDTQAGEAAGRTVAEKIDDDELEDCHHLVRETFIEMTTKRYISRAHTPDLKPQNRNQLPTWQRAACEARRHRPDAFERGRGERNSSYREERGGAARSASSGISAHVER